MPVPAREVRDRKCINRINRAEKRAGGSGFETIKWKQRLYQDMNIEIARANYRMLMERTLPPRVA